MAKKKKKSASRGKKKTLRAETPRTVDVLGLERLSTVTKLIWIDATFISVRQDGVVTMIFETAFVDHGIRSEACRVMMTTDQAKRITDLLARQLDHYPVKKEE